MKFVITENGMEKDLTSCRVLAIIPEGTFTVDNRVCGLNVGMYYEKEEPIDQYMAEKISTEGIVHVLLKNEQISIPLDIHGGSVGTAYYGYINPTVFENQTRV